MIGNKNADMIKVFRNDPAAYEQLERALRSPSLYDEVLRL
jgi:tryptophan 2,3-dioxygenase